MYTERVFVRICRRSVSLIMTVIMLASVCLSVTSCKAEKAETETVPETEPWYNAKRVELDPGFDPEKCSLVLPMGPFLCQDKYVMTYFVFEGSNEESVAYSRQCDLMVVYDQDGNLLHKIDLQAIMMQVPYVYGVFNVMEICESEKGARFYFGEAGFLPVYYCDIDLDTGRQADTPQLIDMGNLKDKDGNDIADDVYATGTGCLTEGYEVFELTNSSRTVSAIVVAKDTEIIHFIDIKKEFGPGEGSIINLVRGIGGGMVIFDCLGESHVWAKLDLATGEVTKLPDGSPFPDEQTVSVSGEGKGYVTKATGIYEYDHTTGEETLKISFDNCDINRFESQYGGVKSFDGDKVVFGCSSRILELYSLPLPAVVYTLEKADYNPNVGKKVVTVASLSDSLTDAEAEALKMFNEQDHEYFAKLVLYDQGYYHSGADSMIDIDNTDRQRYSAMAMVSGSLISDIRSGTGPDIILGAAQSIDLLDGDYLADLTPYLEGKTFNAANFYTNIIDAAGMDGKAYFIPTAFTVTGIATDGSDLQGSGFTYEQYASFVRDQLNGIEPVTRSSSRMHFLNLCIQRNYAQWLKDNKMDFGCEEFRELAGFFRDNVPEGVSEVPDEEKTWTEEYYSVKEFKDAVFIENIDSLKTLAKDNFYGKNLKIMGLPSSDGTGPSAKITNSFSITVGTDVEEGAYVFLDILLSEYVQKDFRDAIPVNRAAVMRKLERENSDNTAGFNRASKTSPELLGSSLENSLRQGALFDPADKVDEVFLNMLEEVDSVLIPDNSVLMIVSEEIPPYLIGQKDIGSVIDAVNSRTRLVFDER